LPDEIVRIVQATKTHYRMLEILRNPVPVTGSYQLNGESLAVKKNQA
jgi:hypothetical protein